MNRLFNETLNDMLVNHLFPLKPLVLYELNFSEFVLKVSNEKHDVINIIQ